MKDNRLFLALSGSGVARAGCDANGDWQVRHLLEDRDVLCLTADPNDSKRLFAGTRNGVLSSTDAGLTWQDKGMSGLNVKSMAVSPHDPELIYAGTKPAYMYVSRDGGNSWTELESFRRIPNRWWWFSPADPPGRAAYVMALTLSPADPNVLLAGIELGAVVRSDDGGQTWSRHRRGALRDCHSLKFHTTNGDWVYEAGGTGGGASYSRDGGQTFQKSKRGLAKKYGIVCGADSVKPEVWYACVASSPFNAFGDSPKSYLYRSTGGAGWQPIGWQPHPLAKTPTALVSIPGKSGHLYAGLSDGDVWHTTDYGDSWEKMPFNLKGIWFWMLILDAP